MIGGTTITRLRWAYTTNALGDRVRTGAPAETTIRGCAVAPRTSADVTEPARQGIVVGLTVYAPATVELDAVTDQIRVDGAVYDIEGEVGRWRSPWTRLRGLQVSLRRVVG